MLPHDVVITGVGAVTSAGMGRQVLWDDVSHGRNTIRWITSFDVTDWPVRYAGEVADCQADVILKRSPGLRRDRGLNFGLVAAREALQHAQLLDDEERVVCENPVSVVVGSGLGPCFEAEYGYQSFFSKGRRSVRPTTVPKSMHNALSGHLSIYFGLLGGSYTVAGACASGALAIGQAWLAIRGGQEEIVLCGGAESPLAPAMFAAWTNLRVLAVADDPARAVRPFDRRRHGLALGEGAAMLVLESAASAQRRGVPILARVTGCGVSSDAHDMTTPAIPGQKMAMERCLASAGKQPEDIDYINAHGTATKANDAAEGHAIYELFGARGRSLPISSTKAVLGHALGASGAMEAVICVDALRHQFVPPTRNLEEPDPDLGLDYVAQFGRPAKLRSVLSNSFAFGGSNCVLLFEV